MSLFCLEEGAELLRHLFTILLPVRRFLLRQQTSMEMGTTIWPQQRPLPKLRFCLARLTETFPTAQNVFTGASPADITSADFNGDGFLDIATANAFGDSSVLLGFNNGSLGPPQPLVASEYSYSIVSGDFNGDNVPDLAIANRESNNVSVFLGKGDGRFSSQELYPVGQNPRSIEVGGLRWRRDARHGNDQFRIQQCFGFDQQWQRRIPPNPILNSRQQPKGASRFSTQITILKLTWSFPTTTWTILRPQMTFGCCMEMAMDLSRVKH